MANHELTDRAVTAPSRNHWSWLPNAVTLTSLVLGVSAIIVLGDRHFITATIFITIAAMLDVLDGHLAQRLNAVSEIGAQLDSLADMVSFGVAPTLLIYYIMRDVGVSPYIALGGAILFALAGALRLARYNVTGAERTAYFTGMPIPHGCALIIAGSFWQHWSLAIWWLIGVAVVSYLMICPLPYPKVQHLSQAPFWVWFIITTITIMSWYLADWQAIPFALLVSYAILGPVYAIRRSHHQFDDAANNNHTSTMRNDETSKIA